ncbi:uncharacterized protein TNIN_200681 [Trichonephila inaurata madagascariensis]|uniref:Uncharacterized protein n=1 Tax=Trichonephila inaurata madagascariensis TaxID=2747483 RepID=A0A8X6X4X1_9ARAC|nr:uncharacterized protein TNIN_200681 [Trichonephila inaurata madagascariensis]
MLLKLFSLGIVLLFTCLYSFVAGECPPAELIEPCTCRFPHDPAIVCYNITKMETITELFERTGELRFKHFTLSHSTLQFLPAHALVSKRVFGLTFENSTLTGLFDETPSSNNLIHMFILDRVRIQRAIQWPMFQKLTKLRILQLVDVTIKRLGKDFINNINQRLAEIFLSDTKTTSLSDGVFENMTDLRLLGIIRSQIKTIKRNMFPRPAKLASLNFMRNQIETLPDDLFVDMPQLIMVNFRDNKIVYLKEAVFAGIYPKLVRLDVDGNPINCDCSLVWLTRLDSYSVNGVCEEPKNKKGTQIRNITKKDLSYCI